LFSCFVSYLESHVVAEADCGESDEAVVKAVEVAPALVAGENSRARERDDGREHSGRQHQIHFRRLRFRKVQPFFGSFYHNLPTHPQSILRDLLNLSERAMKESGICNLLGTSDKQVA